MNKEISMFKNFIKNMNYQTLVKSKRIKLILQNQELYKQGEYVVVRKGGCQLVNINQSEKDPYIGIISPKGYWFGAGKRALGAGYLKKSAGYEIDENNMHTVRTNMFEDLDKVDEDQLMLSMMTSPAFFKVISESHSYIQAAITSAHNQVLWRVNDAKP